MTSCRTARCAESRGQHFASGGGDLHDFFGSAARYSSAKCACGARRLAPALVRSCPSSRRRSAPSAHPVDATCSPATRIGDARRRRGTTGGARGSSQVVAAPGAHHVRAPCAFASTLASMCASAPLNATFRAKFGGAPGPTRLKSLGEGHARRVATDRRCGDRRQPSCESGSSCEHLLDCRKLEFTRVFRCAVLGGVQ